MSHSLSAPHPPGTVRRLLNAPVFRAIIVLSTIFLSCVLYGKNHFFRDPGSVWYDESRAFDREYSAFREWQARQYLEDVDKLVTPVASGAGDLFIKGAEDATFCASFLTVPRHGVEPYLDISIASALDRLSPAERKDLHISAFFATTKVHEHSSYGKPWLKQVLDEVYDYDTILSPGDLEHARELEDANDALRKAPYDYTLPMRHCLDTKAKYIVIFEDDIILAEGWMARTLLGLRDVERKMKDAGRRHEWLYMRLFNQERSTGWGSDKIGGNHETKLSFFIGSAIGIFLVMMRRNFRNVKPYLDPWTIFVICCVFTPAFIVLFFQCGKASLLPPSPGVKEEDYGCCAQALVFNRMHVETLVEYLYMRRHDGYHDMITREFAQIQGLSRWSQYPMLAQHVGTFSAIQKIESESKKVWSMAFESLNPHILSRQHVDMVREVYGPGAEYVSH